MAIEQPSNSKSEDLHLNLTCLCRSTQGFLKIPPSKLPMPLLLCHCSTCRHQSGNIFCAYFKVQTTHGSVFTMHGPLTEYKSIAGKSRYFCENCGTNLYALDHSSSHTAVCSGALEWEGRDNILSLSSHEFVSDTKDGGSSTWLQPVSQPDTNLTRVQQVFSAVFPPYTQKASPPPKRSSELQCHCQCRAIQFKIIPPHEESKKIFSGPLPDLLIPYVEKAHLSQVEQQESENQDGVPWHIRPPHNTRFLAGNCACHSCRKSSGYDIQSWAFVPLVNIISINNKPLDVDLVELKKDGFLTTHQSSPGRYREFCGRCGATVFWHCDWRPRLMDVSVGLIETAEEGVRAESWLDWCLERVSFEEEAENKELVGRLKDGLAAWKERGYGGVNTDTCEGA